MEIKIVILIMGGVPPIIKAQHEKRRTERKNEENIARDSDR